MTSCHSKPGMHLNGFLHPGPTSTSHFLENVLMSRYPGSWCETPHLITWMIILSSQILKMCKLVLNLNKMPKFTKYLYRSVCSILTVFMCRNHIPKLNITFPSEVLVSSDKRPKRNLKFYNVLARQGSSYCNRARLNFQVITLRDMKMAAREGCRVCRSLNSACTRRRIYFNVPDL